MSKYCMIEIAFNNKEEINETINVLLSKRLVASTHIIESNSSWKWKNERESDKESFFVNKFDLVYILDFKC